MKTKTNEIEVQAGELLKLAGLGVNEIGELGFWGYFYAPASKSHHLAVPGGLVQHSINVTTRLVALTKALRLKWPRPESPYLVGMLHDVVKVRSYIVDKTATTDASAPKYIYAPSVYGGHGAASVMMVTSELQVSLYPEEALAIRWHMGAFGLAGDELKEYDWALKAFPALLIATHTADMLAANVDEREQRGM